jgi:hypothetical protein
MENIDIEKYDDINYLSTLLFDFLYNKKSEREIMVEHINLKDIKPSTIKKLYLDKHLRKLVLNVFNRDISFTSKIGNKLIFKINDIDHQLDIVLKASDVYETLNNSTDMNKVMTYLFSDFVIHKETKHILMNVMNFDVKYSEIKYYVEKYLEEHVVKILSKKDKIISVELREHYFRMDTLDDIINSSEENISDHDIIVIIFQVLHTLAIIQNKYPNFRHNNLDLKSIYCYLKDKKDKTYEYKLDGHVFNVPNIGIEIKITHFDESIIINEFDNESIIDSLKTLDNTYDLKIFLNSLLKINKISNEIKIFINDIMNNNNNPKKLLFGSSKFNSFRSKSELSDVSFERNNLNQMSSEVSMNNVPSKLSMKKLLEDMPTEISIERPRKKSSKKRSMKGGAKKKGSKGSKKSKAKKNVRKNKRETHDVDSESEEELTASVEDDDELLLDEVEDALATGTDDDDDDDNDDDADVDDDLILN